MTVTDPKNRLSGSKFRVKLSVACASEVISYSKSATFTIDNKCNSIEGITNLESTLIDVLLNPNPSTEQTVLNLIGNLKEDASFVIHNILGVQVMAGKISKDELLANINITGLLSGTYFVVVYANNGLKTKAITTKLQVNH